MDDLVSCSSSACSSFAPSFAPTPSSCSCSLPTSSSSPCCRRCQRRRPSGTKPINRSHFNALLFIFLTSSLVQLTSATGAFELRLISFRSPDQRRAEGLREQNTVFRVCLKEYQREIDPNPPCVFGSQSLKFDGHRFEISTEGDREFQQTIRLPFSFAWPKHFSLIVEAWSNSSEDQSLLMRIAVQRMLEPGDDWILESHNDSSTVLRLQYRIVCDANFYGSQCQTWCSPRQDDFGHWECSPQGKRQCVTGWKGLACNMAICDDGCEHGTCVEPGLCQCKDGYMGSKCDQCVRYPGCKHGSCNLSFECVCDEGWGGLFCNEDLNYCTRHKPCMNGATCTNTGRGHYTCTCLDGFAGTNCEMRIENCSMHPCHNGGTCRDTVGNFSCVCPMGVSGRYCQITARTCSENPCMNGATCVRAGRFGYKCLCPTEWVGSNCDTEKNACQPNQCFNGGRCVTTSFSRSGYSCVCPVGFEGEQCEKNVDDCQNDACKNGGECVDEVNSFKCRCPPGFSGALCQLEEDICASNRCAAGATCISLGRSVYKCLCSSGFHGKHCEFAIDQCSSNPCRNGGSCEQLSSIDAYRCHCPSCFSGTDCLIRDNDCLSRNFTWQTPLRGDRTSFERLLLILSIPLVLLTLLVVLATFIIAVLFYRRSRDHLKPKLSPAQQNCLNDIRQMQLKTNAVPNKYEVEVIADETATSTSRHSMMLSVDKLNLRQMMAPLSGRGCDSGIGSPDPSLNKSRNTLDQDAIYASIDDDDDDCCKRNEERRPSSSREDACCERATHL